jgi:hypothetical protein
MPMMVGCDISTDKECSPTEADLTPTQKVFGITELCEKILDNLALCDLFLAQFICHRTQSVIEGLKTLQE